MLNYHLSCVILIGSLHLTGTYIVPLEYADLINIVSVDTSFSDEAPFYASKISQDVASIS